MNEVKPELVLKIEEHFTGLMFLDSGCCLGMCNSSRLAGCTHCENAHITPAVSAGAVKDSWVSKPGDKLINRGVGLCAHQNPGSSIPNGLL